MARPRGNRWQADVLIGGKRKRRSFKTQREAEAWEAEIERSVSRGDSEDDIITRHEGIVSGKGTFSDFWNDHFELLWGGTVNAQNARRHLLEFNHILGATATMASLDYPKVVELVGVLKDSGNGNATLNRKMATLSKLLTHAKKYGVIPDKPDIPRFKESKGRIRFFTKREEQMILDRMEHLGLIDAMQLTKLLLYTGARRSEAHALRPIDVDFRNNSISFWETKADEPRSLPITPPVREATEHFLPTAGQHLVSIEYETYRLHWERVRDDLGYADDPHFVPHTLRHTCCSRLVQAGVDLRRVQQWMGHKAIATTLRYAHLAPKDLEVAAGALMGQ